MRSASLQIIVAFLSVLAFQVSAQDDQGTLLGDYGVPDECVPVCQAFRNRYDTCTTMPDEKAAADCFCGSPDLLFTPNVQCGVCAADTRFPIPANSPRLDRVDLDTVQRGFDSMRNDCVAAGYTVEDVDVKTVTFTPGRSSPTTTSAGGTTTTPTTTPNGLTTSKATATPPTTGTGTSTGTSAGNSPSQTGAGAKGMAVSWQLAVAAGAFLGSSYL